MEINQGTSGILITFNEYELNQHELEIRADERKKVVAELQEWNDKLIDEGYIIDYEELEQKLTKLKGE